MKNSLFGFLILSSIVFASVLSACNRDDTAQKWAEEEAKLAEWIKENDPEAFFENGIYIKKLISYPDNIQPEAGDHLLVNYASCFLYEGNVEQVSYKNWEAYGARNHSMYREGGPELWAPVSDFRVSTGIDYLREKESAVVYVPSRKLNLQDFITRKIDITLVKVIETDLKTYQEELMDFAMKEFGSKIEEPIIIADQGREYYVWYHIKNVHSEEAATTATRTNYSEYYCLQNGDFRTCAENQTKNVGAWDKKFSKMFDSVKKGAKITVVMPYRIMYGEESYTDKNTKQHIAPRGSVLKYVIEVDN